MKDLWYDEEEQREIARLRTRLAALDIARAVVGAVTLAALALGAWLYVLSS